MVRPGSAPGVDRSAPGEPRSAPAPAGSRGISRQPPLAPGRNAGGRDEEPRSPSHVAPGRSSHRASPAPAASHRLPRRRGRRIRSRPSCSRGEGRGRDCVRWTPPSSFQRSSGATGSPRSIASIVSANIGVDHDALAVLDLHDHVERGRRLPLQDALLGPAPARLLVAERDALDPADQVGERGVQHQLSRLLPWAVPIS